MDSPVTTHPPWVPLHAAGAGPPTHPLGTTAVANGALCAIVPALGHSPPSKCCNNLQLLTHFRPNLQAQATTTVQNSGQK